VSGPHSANDLGRCIERDKARRRRRMKHVETRRFADRQAAARKLLELAAGVEPVNGRIHIEKINAPFLSKNGCKGAEFGAGICYAVGWTERRD